MKKISLILTSLVFCISAVFIFPAKEANANPIAVGGALYLGGAGVYVLGAVGVAGLAGLAGCTSCQEDIEAHASRTWEGSTQIVKDGIQLMVDSSIGAWGATSSALTATDANVNTWVDSKINGMAEAIDNSYAKNTIIEQDSMVTRDSEIQLTLSLRNGFTAKNGAGTYTTALYVTAGNSSYTVNGINKLYSGSSVTKASLIAEMNSVTSLATFMALIAAYGSPSLLHAPTFDTATAKNNMTESWQDMKDAGLVLPTDNARPMYNNVPLTYDPTTDTYAGIDGITVPHEDVTGFEYQKPHWKTLEDLAALGLSGLGAGLYIDGWPTAETTTSTYDPVTDTTTTVTSTGTTTNVTTGETAVTGTTTTTTTGDTTGNPPVDPPPVTPPKTSEPVNPFKGVVPGASILSLFKLLVAIIWYLIRMFTFIATIAFIAPTPIDNPYFMWFTTATFYGITPFPLVQNLALFFLGFSIYKSIRRVF